jgi:tRNA threonylcarbamoyladenosine biosynthesis protein TsaE
MAESAIVSRAYQLEDLAAISKETISLAAELKIWLIEGDMGAGKTTLVKAIGKEMGIQNTISSPTFSIVNEYTTANNETVYHFDFYRLKTEAEAYDLGANEYFDSGNLCIVEWPEKIPSLIPEHFFKINLEINDSQSRTIHYAKY